MVLTGMALTNKLNIDLTDNMGRFARSVDVFIVFAQIIAHIVYLILFSDTLDSTPFHPKITMLAADIEDNAFFWSD
jgi:hypothetical protein